MRLRGLQLSTVLRLLRWKATAKPVGPLHVFLCIVDHFEPMVEHAPEHVQDERLQRWVRDYPASVAGIADSRGQSPQHTFFWPAECYHSRRIDQLAGLCRRGHGSIEVHLHHDQDNAEHMRETLEIFTCRMFTAHGMLAKDAAGRISYGFVHGNWALNNSRPDGRWCGVRGELAVLRDTGCYADFTFPSAPDPTQPRTLNSIYYASGDLNRCDAHEAGVPAAVGIAPPPQSLLMIQGPLALDWRRRKLGLLPGLENADLHNMFPPTMARFALWLRAGIGVIGRPEWLFIKLHTHGAPERNAAVLLGEPMRRFHLDLADYARHNPGFKYYYVTARQMAAIVHQAEQRTALPQIDIS